MERVIDFRSHVKYCEDSPTFAVWVKSHPGGRSGGRPITIGSPAGFKDEEGYLRISVQGDKYLLHRVIWEITYASIPEGHMIDHVDGDKTNNRLSNLRVVLEENSRNHPIRHDNTSGKCGVSLNSQNGIPDSRWIASWRNNGKCFSKSFSIAKYGDEAFNLAVEARDKAIKKLNEAGAGYTESHGLRIKGI